MTGGRDARRRSGRAPAARRDAARRRGAIRLRHGGVAIVGAIATPHRAPGTRGRDAGRERRIRASPRSGVACGRGSLGTSAAAAGASSRSGPRRAHRHRQLMPDPARLRDRLLGYPDRRPGAGDRLVGAGRCIGGRSARRGRDRGRGRHPVAPVRRPRAGRLHRARRGQRPGRVSSSSASTSRSSRRSTSTCPAWTASRPRSASAPSARPTS